MPSVLTLTAFLLRGGGLIKNINLELGGVGIREGMLNTAFGNHNFLSPCTRS